MKWLSRSQVDNRDGLVVVTFCAWQSLAVRVCLGFPRVDAVEALVKPDTLTHKWAKAAKAASVRHIRLRDARHTCGTTMHLRKVPMAVIAAWLGHADASVTARIYTHSQAEALAAASSTLGEVVTTRDIEAG
ncbi:tyrosine-type recombinase/integrase [Nocardia fluminea]|uniref:tyrosine-type recombinase/integrase n=1 Tax=Nocardia fluminea TaxID=134984 RepID=UPI003716D7B0